ncbi:MAG: chemotaxis protein CheB [Actinomycetes bacterium]
MTPSQVPKYQGHIVAIGASAGGLDALAKLFEACPTDIGAAFVVIQHLSPSRTAIRGC